MLAGFQAHISQCNIDSISFFYGSLGIIIGLMSMTPCSGFCATVAAVIAIQIGYIYWLNSRRGGDGVMANVNWAGNYWFWSVC